MVRSGRRPAPTGRSGARSRRVEALRSRPRLDRALRRRRDGSRTRRGARELVVERLAHQRVREAVAARPLPRTSTTTRAASASSSASSSAISGLPQTRASSGRSNSRPSTEATPSTSLQRRRQPIEPAADHLRTPCGISRLHEPAPGAREPPSATSSRTTSCTKNGLPSVSRWTASTSPARRRHAGGIAR